VKNLVPAIQNLVPSLQKEKERPAPPAAPIAIAAAGVSFLFAAGFEVARRFYRNAQLFAPSTEPIISWDPADYGLDPAMVDEIWFTNEEGHQLHGWYCRAENPVASTLHCHGNTGNLTNSAAAFRHYVSRGLSVFVFDYRGFGKSEGRPSIRGVVRDSLASASEHDRIRPRDIPSVLNGYSLGGAVAAQVALEHHFDALVLQSTFTNLPEITKALFPTLPLHHVCGRAFDTLSVVERLQIPLLIIHGTEDESIPVSMAQSLYDRCGSAKLIELIDGGMHKDLFDIDPERIIGAMRRLLDENVRCVLPQGECATAPQASAPGGDDPLAEAS
jgi:uncharacterized protein